MSEIKKHKARLIFIQWTVWSILGLLATGCYQNPEYTPIDSSGKQKIITEFREGKITIDGKTFHSHDILIFPDRVKHNWGAMMEDHNLAPEEVKDIAEADIKTVIFGTGTAGNVTVSKKTLVFLQSKGMATHVLNSFDAVDLYNKSPKEKLAMVIHLTN